MPAVVVASWIKHVLMSNIACPFIFAQPLALKFVFLLVASSVELCSNQQSLDLEATSPAAKLRPKGWEPNLTAAICTNGRRTWRLSCSLPWLEPAFEDTQSLIGAMVSPVPEIPI